MICKNCGSQYEEGTNFCQNCGTKLENEQVPCQAYVTPEAEPSKGMAIASLVLGILSLIVFPIITGTLGIIFGGIAKKNGNKSGNATAGIVCGIIGLASWVLIVACCTCFTCIGVLGTM